MVKHDFSASPKNYVIGQYSKIKKIVVGIESYLQEESLNLHNRQSIGGNAFIKTNEPQNLQNFLKIDSSNEIINTEECIERNSKQLKKIAVLHNFLSTNDDLDHYIGNNNVTLQKQKKKKICKFIFIITIVLVTVITVICFLVWLFAFISH